MTRAIPNPASVTSWDASNAVAALLAGRPVPVEITRVLGCSTKWLEKKSEVAPPMDEQWKALPVTLEAIDAAGVAALARNDTKCYRLINVWATWCAPCVAEFPGLVSITRRLSNRDFEMITISIDDPKEQPAVLAFLQKQHMAIPNRVKRSITREGRRTDNYLYSGAKVDALAAALDPSWAGPVPYTFAHRARRKDPLSPKRAVDAADLQARLVDQLGPYY